MAAYISAVRDLKGNLEPSDLDRLIGNARNPRNRAFIALLARDGIRIFEVTQFQWSPTFSW